jgi:preprotein translocase subunit YajC
MSESVIIALLAIITFLLYSAALKQRKKSKQIRKRMVDKAKRRDEI